MRIAVLILGLVLGAVMFFETFVVSMVGITLAPSALLGSALFGLGLTLLWLIAVAFVLRIPVVSGIAFAIAAALGLLAPWLARGTPYAPNTDIPLWGVVSLVLALLSLGGVYEQRRDAQRAEARHREMVLASARADLQSRLRQP